MEAAFGPILFAVVIVSAVIAVATLRGRAELYDRIGKDGLSMDGDAKRPAMGSAMANAERDAEVRQMLTAKNARRMARGEEPLDVEAELTRLTTETIIDPALESEVRDMVVARNARRKRRGEEPLDVEAEVRRQLDALA